jgi:RNA polymerase sigma-70 factor (ECF subfamily)
LARVHYKTKILELEAMSTPDETLAIANSIDRRDPEQQAAASEMSRILEEAILGLPATYRSVLVLRDVEELSTAECAQILEVSEENVKVRIHRARRMLRKELYARAGMTVTSAFGFLDERCDRVVKAVLKRIGSIQPS